MFSTKIAFALLGVLLLSGKLSFAPFSLSCSSRLYDCVTGVVCYGLVQVFSQFLVMVFFSWSFQLLVLLRRMKMLERLIWTSVPPRKDLALVGVQGISRLLAPLNVVFLSLQMLRFWRGRRRQSSWMVSMSLRLRSCGRNLRNSLSRLRSIGWWSSLSIPSTGTKRYFINI